MRVLFAALALSILSFAAGIAGDLSIAAPPPPSVILHLPPPIPANALRAHPLPPLTTAMVHAEPAVAYLHQTFRNAHHHPRQAEQIAARVKPEAIQLLGAAKVDRDRAPKNDGLETAQI
ncbi:MAG: hypothetical protein HY054_08000 [Proteobacteria bacterium]|nr:hypothetical protein [Pseudomonadota bacterium]